MPVLAEVSAERTRIILSVEYGDNENVKMVPGTRFDTRAKVWHAPLSWAACKALRGVFGDRLVVGPSLLAWGRQELEARVTPCMALRRCEDAPGWGPDGLRDYQRVGVAMMVTGQQVLLGDDMGTGKGQPVDARVLTPSGWRKIGDLSVGDEVTGSDGRATAVTGVYPRGLLPTYDVTFTDGATIRVDGDHLWRVETAVDTTRGRTRVLATAQLAEDPAWSHGAAKWFIPVVASVEYAPLTVSLPIDPYALGVLIGNGSLIRASLFSTHYEDQDVADEVAKRLAPLGVDVVTTGPVKGTLNHACTTTRGQSNPLTDALRSLGLLGKLSHEKFIPTQYLRAPVADRILLLRGLMDTDGGAGRSSVEFSTSSPQLAFDVQDLVESLGGLARIISQTTPRRNAYCMAVRLPYNVFWSARKRAMLKDRERPIRRGIVSVTPAPVEDIVCISVAASDQLYVTERHVVTHNTVMGAVALETIHRTGTPGPYLVVCPNTVKRGWERELGRWAPSLTPIIVRGTATKRRQMIETAAEDPTAVLVMNWESLKLHSRLAPYGQTRLRPCSRCVPGDDGKPTSCERCPRELNEVKFGAIIGDEAHRAKDPRAKQTRALWAVSHGPSTRYRWALTGTPIADAIDDLWSIMHFLSPDEFPRKTAYLDRYGLLSYNAFGGMEVVGIRPETRDEFFSVFDPRFLRRPREYALRDVKEPQRETRFVEMSPKQARLYRELAVEMAARLEDGSTLVVPNPLTQTTRLNQAAASYLERNECVPCAGTGAKPLAPDEKCTGCNGRGYRFNPILPSNKLDGLLELLEELPAKEQVVVFAVSRRLIERVSDALTAKGITNLVISGAVKEEDRYGVIDKFRAGDARVCLVVIDAGGEGLDGLQCAQVGVFLQRHYSRLKNVQAEGRLVRSGQEGQTLLIDFRSEHTIEDDKEAILAEKEGRFDELCRDRQWLADLIRRSAK